MSSKETSRGSDTKSDDRRGQGAGSDRHVSLRSGRNRVEEMMGSEGSCKAIERWQDTNLPTGGLSSGFFGFSTRLDEEEGAASRNERLVLEMDLVARCLEKLSDWCDGRLANILIVVDRDVSGTQGQLQASMVPTEPSSD